MARLLRSVFTARQLAWEHCGQTFAPTEAENLRPYYARAHLEGLMRGVADRHPAIMAEVVRQDGQPWNHTVLSNGPVVLTAATVQAPGEMVDPSGYRRALAGSPQVQLESMADPEPKDGILYVLLLHSRSYFADPNMQRDYGFLPGSVYLAYPNADMSFYRHKINLFDRFRSVVETLSPDEWDQQTFNLYIERSRVPAMPRKLRG